VFKKVPNPGEGGELRKARLPFSKEPSKTKKPGVGKFSEKFQQKGKGEGGETESWEFKLRRLLLNIEGELR